MHSLKADGEKRWTFQAYQAVQQDDTRRTSNRQEARATSSRLPLGDVLRKGSADVPLKVTKEEMWDEIDGLTTTASREVFKQFKITWIEQEQKSDEETETG